MTDAPILTGRTGVLITLFYIGRRVVVSRYPDVSGHGYDAFRAAITRAILSMDSRTTPLNDRAMGYLAWELDNYSDGTGRSYLRARGGYRAALSKLYAVLEEEVKRKGRVS